MEILIFKIIIVVILLVGLVGAILPVLPGAPLSLTVLLLAKLFGLTELSWWVMALFAVFTAMGILLDYLIPLLTVKKMGGSKWGVVGLFVGLIIGVIFSPFGFFSIILGPLLGAFLGELLYDRSSHRRAWKSAFASLLGFVLTTGYGLLLCLSMLMSFVLKDLF